MLTIALAVAGLVPVVITGLGALSPNANAGSMLAALIGYAAIALALLGGLFLATAEPLGATTQRWSRLGLGVVPALAGWLALLLPGWLGLAVLIAGYILLIAAERQATQRGMPAPGYRVPRWCFMLVVVAMLITVLTLRLLGQTIAI
jgi:hypothetical protein